MKDSERQQLKEKIADTIISTEKEIIEMEKNTRPIAPENAIGRVSRMDAINNKSVSEAALRSAKRKLANLKIAQSKTDQPNFGNCARCGQPIPTARLMYMPQSAYCVRCADHR